MAATEFAVRINSKDGALEVVGPDKDWVDAKLVELQSVFTDYAGATENDGDDTASTSAARKPVRRKRTKPASPATRDGDSTATTKRRSGAGGRAETNSELLAKLTPDIKKSFDEYRSARAKAWDGSLSAQAAIIATFLHDQIAWPGVDQHDLYTVYSAMGLKTPRNMRSQLVNARQRARYFTGIVDGKAILSHAGENFARHDSLTAGDDES